MAITITHPYVSSITESTLSGVPSGRVGPSEWNATHTVSGESLPTAGANLTFYVSPSGSDSNSGTSGSPFATFQHAVNVAVSYNWQNLYTPTIQGVTGGTFSTGQNIVIPPLTNALQITFQGDMNLVGSPTVSVSDGFVIAVSPGQTVNFLGQWTLGAQSPFLINSGCLNLTSRGTSVYNDTFYITHANSQAITIQQQTGQNGQAYAIFNGLFFTFDYTAVTSIFWFLGQSGGSSLTEECFFQISSSATTINDAWLDASGAAGGFVRWHVRPAKIPNLANLSGTRIIADQAAQVTTFYGVQSDIPGTVDGRVDNSVVWEADQLPLWSQAVKTTTEAPLPATQSAGDVLNNCWQIIKDTTHGQRWLAFNDGPHPDVFNTPGTVYLSQIGKFVNTSTSTNYTLALTDTDGIVEMNNSGANTVTVPSSSTVNFPIGTKISVVQIGAGATSPSTSAGPTIHGVGALAGQYKSALLYKRGADEWVQINGAF